MRMNKNKKAFTLIELLAVLVVLAILALISIPITIRIINSTRENSYKRSVEGYGRAVESYIGEYLIYHDINYKDITYDMIKNNIHYNGSNVTCGSMSFQNNGDIVLRNCHVDDSKNYKYINRHVIEEKSIYTVGELIKVNDIDFNDIYFYVIENSDSSKDYVTALKANPLTFTELQSAGATRVWDCGESKGHIGRMIYGDSSDYTTSDIKSVVDTWANIKFIDKLKIVDGYAARLIKISELENLGYIKSDYYTLNSNIPNWVYDSWYDYWTMSQYNESSLEVWRVHHYGHLNDTSALGDGDVVRPVINVYKSAIQS